MLSIGSNFKRSSAGYFILAILCLPVFFINVRDSHDWGDDFAAYIHGAANIVNGIPQSETGFVYNEDYNDISVVPDIGFPLLLSPVYALSGNDVKALSLFISLILYALSFALMYFYNKYFSPLTSIFLTLIIIYNPWTLTFKATILSDIPFTLFLLLCVSYFLAKGIRKPLNCVLLGIMVGYLISIRTIGLAFPTALFFLFIKSFMQTPAKDDKIKLVKNNLILAASIVGFYFLLNKLLFSIPTQGSYIDESQLTLKGMGSALATNLQGYFNFIPTYIRSLGRYEFMSITTRILAVGALLTGLLYKYKEKMDLMEFLLAIYVCVILLFAASHERYLLPMLPFLLYYMVIGLKRIKLNWNINKNMVISALGVFVLVQYYPEVKWIVLHQNEVQKGPHETSSVEAFDYIKKNIPKNSVIVFAKPRALALYTDRKSMAIEATPDLKKLKNKFEKKGVTYFLIHMDETKEKTLSNFIEEYKEETELIWSNEKFFLYKMI